MENYPGKKEKNLLPSALSFFPILLFLFFSTNFLLADSTSKKIESNSPPEHFNGYFLRHILKNTENIVLSPAHWTDNDWLSAGLASIATVAFLPVDNSIHKWVVDEESSASHSMARAFSTVGSPTILLGLVTTGYLFGEIYGQTKTRQAFLLSAESLLITEIFVQVGKIGFGRARPYAGEGAFSFHPLSFQGKWQSFPSGHAAAAWSLASCLASSTNSLALKISLYSLASGISLSRVLLDKHFASDVVAASLLGFFIGKKIGQPLHQIKNKPQISMITGPGIIAISLNYSY